MLRLTASAKTLCPLRSQSELLEVQTWTYPFWGTVFKPLQIFCRGVSKTNVFLAAEKSLTAAGIDRRRNNNEWTATGSRNVARPARQAPPCVWMIYLGGGKRHSVKAPQTHMFPAPGFCSCVSVGEHYSQNQDPKIKPHKDPEYLSKVNFELGNIPQKCWASVRLSFVICSLPPKSFLCSASHTSSRRAPPHALGGPSQQTRGKLNPLRKCTQPVLLNGLLNRWASFPSLCWI